LFDDARSKPAGKYILVPIMQNEGQIALLLFRNAEKKLGTIEKIEFFKPEELAEMI
jgi:hypothetical protein